MRNDDTALESVKHRGCCNRLILEANNERLRAENGRLNAQVAELRAALASINKAASRILSEPGNDTGALVTVCTIADKALAAKPAPEVERG